MKHHKKSIKSSNELLPSKQRYGTITKGLGLRRCFGGAGAGEPSCRGNNGRLV